MISKEQIAHDLAIVYLQNRYGVNLRGDFSVNDGTGIGSLETEHFPSASEPRYVKVPTGEKGFLGLERKERVKSGNKADALFKEIFQDYGAAYSFFYEMLCTQDASSAD